MNKSISDEKITKFMESLGFWFDVDWIEDGVSYGEWHSNQDGSVSHDMATEMYKNHKSLMERERKAAEGFYRNKILGNDTSNSLCGCIMCEHHVKAAQFNSK